MTHKLFKTTSLPAGKIISLTRSLTLADMDATKVSDIETAQNNNAHPRTFVRAGHVLKLKQEHVIALLQALGINKSNFNDIAYKTSNVDKVVRAWNSDMPRIAPASAYLQGDVNFQGETKREAKWAIYNQAQEELNAIASEQENALVNDAISELQLSIEQLINSNNERIKRETQQDIPDNIIDLITSNKAPCDVELSQDDIMALQTHSAAINDLEEQIQALKSEQNKHRYEMNEILTRLAKITE
jgi:hypothetical protein